MAAAKTPGHPRSQRRAWPAHYPKIRYWEYAATAASFGVLAYVQFGVYTRRVPSWEGGILFDDAVRDGLRLKTRSGREKAGLTSDVFWGLTWALPTVDMILLPILDRSFTLFWQLAWMNALVYGTVAATSRVMHKVTKRARPLWEGCKEEGAGYDAGCDGAPSDFFSGHTAVSAAAAGLTCVHHQFLPLYGKRWADTTACASALTSAAAVGLFRILADRHYTSSVLIGYAVGFSIGYGLPWLLHYRRPARGFGKEGAFKSVQPKAPPTTAIVTPFGSEDRLGLQLVGQF